jgi:hypothetical protein
VEPDDSSILTAAFAAQELELVDEIPLVIAERARPRKRGLAGRPATVQLDVPLEGKARAYVFKFAVRLAGNQIVRFLERKIKQGLIAITSPDPGDWHLLDSVEPLPQTLPTGRRPRVLLLVHGTFSSTLGSFGALGSGDWGKELLQRALSAYDAVLGFDHPTLSVDPQVNAVDMLTRLEGIDWPEPPIMDIVAFSRGGLVVRSLIEQLLPASPWKAQIHRVIFVGCTNEGTKLAEPDNWHRLADRYTNFAIWGTRALSLIPGAQAVGAIAGEAIQGVATLVKVLATHAVTDNGVPGLAAMEPDGAFVTTINQTQPGQPTTAEALYCAVLSNFEPGRALADGTTPELPPKLLMRLADKTIDDLFGESNDLVVHTRSMTAIDPHVGGFVKDKLDFGTNGVVYHTIYFTRRETVSALARWLGLDSAGSVALEPRPPLIRPGAVVAGSASPIARSNILVVGAEKSIGSVLRAAKVARPDYVVVEREYQNTDLYYAYSPEELRKITKGVPARTPLQESLNLHESDASIAKPDAPGVGVMRGADTLRPVASRTIDKGCKKKSSGKKESRARSARHAGADRPGGLSVPRRDGRGGGRRADDGCRSDHFPGDAGRTSSRAVGLGAGRCQRQEEPDHTDRRTTKFQGRGRQASDREGAGTG